MTSPPQDSNPAHAAVVGTTQVGERGDRYEILRVLGSGGMATVYLARQLELDRFVALKEMSAAPGSDPTWAQRFLREARMGGSLSHPNIVTVYDYFVRDGTPCIAMEYVENGSLRPYIRHVTLAQIGGVLEAVLAGLAHAQVRGDIVHRDLKPENLMVTAEGRVKIADFGIAKATSHVQTEFLTQTGVTVGTPHYMAPEQAMADKYAIGAWTDLYSVGCIAYELLTSRVPFHDTDTPVAILLRHVNEAIPPVTSVAPDVDQRIADWVATLLVKEPKQRAQTAQLAWDELEDVLLSLLGPRWRREARLAERPQEEADDAKPLTPAAFERPPDDAEADEFVSFSWGPQGSPAPTPAETPAPLVEETPAPIEFAAPPPESGPPPVATPQPPPPPPPVVVAPDVSQPVGAASAPQLEDAETVPPRRPAPSVAPPPDTVPSRRRGFAVLSVVLLVAVAAGTAAFLLRPNGNETAESPPAKPAGPAVFAADAFSVRLPAGWHARCLDTPDECSERQVEPPTRQSLFVKGRGTDAPRIAIDRTPASADHTLAGQLDGQERALTDLDGYRRDGDVRTDEISPTRRARALSFRSSDHRFRVGAVYVFKVAGDIYVVTGTASTPAIARDAARQAARSVQSR